MGADTAAAKPLELELEGHRRELTAYCYRMLGSGFEAEDAVQETLVRAWRKIDGFEGRSSLRSWLYRIATNVCLDMVQGPQRRAQPMDLGPSQEPDGRLLGAPLPERTFVTPVADAKVLPTDADPAAVAEARESIRLAFVAALQHLPPKQRAVLILREVLRWQATEVAELLDTSVASVNSALQRARATLDSIDGSSASAAAVAQDPEKSALLAKYVRAFEAYDIESLVQVLRDDVAFTMPPFALWLRGPADVAAWMVGPGAECEGSRLVPTWASGRPAFACYHRAPDGGYRPFALQVIETDGERITEIHNFLQPELFPACDLPTTID